jgi:hypothetical protein
MYPGAWEDSVDGCVVGLREWYGWSGLVVFANLGL